MKNNQLNRSTLFVTNRSDIDIHVLCRRRMSCKKCRTTSSNCKLLETMDHNDGKCRHDERAWRRSESLDCRSKENMRTMPWRWTDERRSDDRTKNKDGKYYDLSVLILKMRESHRSFAHIWIKRGKNLPRSWATVFSSAFRFLIAQCTTCSHDQFIIREWMKNDKDPEWSNGNQKTYEERVVGWR